MWRVKCPGCGREQVVQTGTKHKKCVYGTCGRNFKITREVIVDANHAPRYS